MKGQGSLSRYTVDYEAVNKLTPLDFLLTPVEFQHPTKAIRYTLSQVLSRYFGKELRKERVIVKGI